MIAVKIQKTEKWLTQTGEGTGFLFIVFPSTAVLMRNDDYSI